MLTVREALSLEQLSEFSLLAGEGGLGNEITNVSMLDYEGESMDFTAFMKGDFVLTSLLFAKDDASLIKKALRLLIRRGISGVAIKSVYYSSIPDDAKRLADAMNLPIFTYHTTYMEDIILAISAFKAAKEQQVYAVKRLDMLLGAEHTQYAIMQTARAIDAMLYPNCVAAFCAPDCGVMSETPAHMQRSLLREGAYSLIIPYKAGLLMLYTVSAPDALADEVKLITERFSECGVEISAWQTGISAPCLAYESYDVAVRQCIDAYTACRCLDARALRFGDMGVYRFIPAMLSDKGLMREYEAALLKLAAFEKDSGIPLTETLAAYAKARGSVDKAAALIYQHPNTIRNRLKKAHALLCLESDGYEQIFLLMCIRMFESERSKL